MIHLPFRRSRPDRTIAGLYGTIVAQARSPIFYRGYGVPDTAAGRFDMIVLHLVLFLQRLRSESPAAQALGQEVFNLFCRDIDDNFREMGMGDLAVPREMRKVGEAFYGRAAAYETALATDDAALTAALVRNIFGEFTDGAKRLAIYMRAAARLLAMQHDFSSAELRFPDPEDIAPVHLEEGQRR